MQRAESKFPCAATTISFGSPAWYRDTQQPSRALKAAQRSEVLLTAVCGHPAPGGGGWGHLSLQAVDVLGDAASQQAFFVEQAQEVMRRGRRWVPARP